MKLNVLLLLVTSLTVMGCNGEKPSIETRLSTVEVKLSTVEVEADKQTEVLLDHDTALKNLMSKNNELKLMLSGSAAMSGAQRTLGHMPPATYQYDSASSQSPAGGYYNNQPVIPALPSRTGGYLWEPTFEAGSAAGKPGDEQLVPRDNQWVVTRVSTPPSPTEAGSPPTPPASASTSGLNSPQDLLRLAQEYEKWRAMIGGGSQLEAKVDNLSQRVSGLDARLETLSSQMEDLRKRDAQLDAALSKAEGNIASMAALAEQYKEDCRREGWNIVYREGRTPPREYYWTRRMTGCYNGTYYTYVFGWYGTRDKILYWHRLPLQ